MTVLSASPSLFLPQTVLYRGMGSVCVYLGMTNTRLNDEDEESFYINRQNPIISLRELS